MKKRASVIYSTFALLFTGLLFLGNETGRRGFYAGAPSDLTCIDCHTDITHAGTGLSLMGAPADFVAGQSYPLTLTLNHSGSITGGFQIVATDAAVGDNAMFGSFTAGTGSKIASATGNGAGRLTHSASQAFSGNSTSWTFYWVAPTTGSGVKFYYAGVASNGDLDETVGDAVYVGNQQTLPIELVSFSGKKEGNTVKLTWKTASERDNAYFTIQRSGTQTTTQFEDIGTVKGAGNSTMFKIYDFTDDKPLNETVSYYRLKQVDTDGKTTYSKIVSIGAATTLKSIKVQPSIVSRGADVVIQMADSPAANLDVIDLTGRVVLTVRKPQNTEGVILPTSGLSAGRYFVRSAQSWIFQTASFVVF
jgi:hypothetical protein